MPRQARAWPGASLLSSAFCNALPFYFTALHNAAGPPPLTPAALGSRPARRAHQDKNGEAVPAGESPSLPMTTGWKARSQPQHRPADTNGAETLTALIFCGSTQVRPLTARHDAAFIAALVLITFSYTIYIRSLKVPPVAQVNSHEHRTERAPLALSELELGTGRTWKDTPRSHGGGPREGSE